MRRALLLAIALAATGCGARGFVTSPADYAAYRATRVRPTLEDRLQAAGEYLRAYPEGAFADDVRGYVDRAEPALWADRQKSIAGLQGYVRALPAGPHRAQADRLLLELTAVRDRHDLVTAEDVTAHVDKASAERLAVRTELSAWIGRFLDPKLYGARLSEAKAEVIIPWSLSLPMPSCVSVDAAHPAPGFPPPAGAARRCAKLLELPYSVVVNGAPEAREVTLELALFEDLDGRPLELRAGGPDLLLRLEETFTVRAAPRGDSERQVAAMSRAAELVRDVFGKAVSADPSCRKPPAAPVFLDLACQGLRVTIRAAVTPGEDDLVTVGPG